MNSRFMLLAPLFGFLASCGGGGGGPIEPEPPLPYVGLITPAVLSVDGDGASRLASAYAEGAAILLQDTLAKTTSLSTQQSSIKRNPLESHAAELEGKKNLLKVTVAEKVSETIACDSGSGTVTFDGNLQTAIGTQINTFDHCSMAGVVMNGSIKTIIASSSLQTVWKVTSTSNAEVTSLDGTLSQEFSSNSVTHAHLNLLVSHNTEMRLYKDVDLTAGVITGQIFDSSTGYVTISTPVALDLNRQDQNFVPTPVGTVVLSGDGNAQLRFQIEPPKYSTEPVPGTTSQQYNWRWAAGLYLGSATVPSKESWEYGCGDGLCVEQVKEAVAPVIGMRYGSQHAQFNSSATLDASFTRDDNGDLLSFDWQPVSQPQGSQLTLAAAHGSKYSFVPDVTGPFVFKLTVSDGTHTVEKNITLDSYQSTFFDNIDANVSNSGMVPSSGYVFDENNNRIISLLPGYASPRLQSIDINSAQISSTPLAAAPQDSHLLSVSENGNYLAVASHAQVALLNAKTLALIGTFDIATTGADLHPSVHDIIVSTTGRVYAAYGTYSTENTKTVEREHVIDIDFSGQSATYTRFVWGDEGEGLLGFAAKVVSLDEAHQRLTISQSRWTQVDGPITHQELRSASINTHSQLAYREHLVNNSFGIDPGSSWYLANNDVFVDQFGSRYSADSFAEQANKLAEVKEVFVIAAHNQSGVLWYGYTEAAGLGQPMLNRAATLDQMPESSEGPWNLHPTYHPDFSANKVEIEPVVIFVSKDQKHQFWIARHYQKSSSNINHFEFIRY